MALDVGVFQNLQQPKPVDILGPYRTLQDLRTQQLQQADIASQVQERQAIAQQRNAAVQRTTQAAQVIHDHILQGGALDDDALMNKLYAVDPAIAENFGKTQTEAKKTASEIATKKITADTEAARAKTAADELQEKINARIAKEQKEQAEEAAGALIPGTEFTTPDQAGKPQRAAQFRVRQSDGTYRNETRMMGLEAPAPANPPQPQAPMSPERFAQELALEKQKAALNGNNSVPPLDFLTETSSTGVPFIDASKVEPKTLNALQAAAGQAGRKVVDKDTAQGLRDIVTAKANQQSMMDLLNGRLPENPLSRILVAPENKLKALGQLDPNLAITGTFVGPAIASLRAVAGSRNFRITKAEVDAAAQNFVPVASDTVDTAKAKMAALAHFMDNKEHGVLGINGATPAPTARPRASDGKGNFVEWDGSAWVPAK